MERRCDPLSVVCPEPECAAAPGQKCDPLARRVWVDPISGKESSRAIDLTIGKPGIDWHEARYQAVVVQVLASEPPDDRPWCERSLTSIKAELDRMFRRMGRE